MSISGFKYLAVFALLGLSSAAQAGLQEPVPAAVENHVAAYVAAVNAPDQQAADAFRNEHTAAALVEGVPRKAFVGFFETQHRVLGGVDLVETRMRDEDTVVALLRSRLYGALIGVTLDLEAGPDQKVANLDPGPAPPWAPMPEPILSAGEFSSRTRLLANRGCNANVFSGAFLVAKGPDVLAQGACGLASRRYMAPNTIDTRFNLGSMNKMFTAVAVMQLVEAGRLSLDDPLSRYVDETWLPADVSSTITVRHLLTHTSGLGSFLGPEFQRSSRLRFRNLADYAALVQGERPAFRPGSDYRYSNTGMLLAGVVIERVSGQDYFAYVRDHIFQPAGMASTDSWPMDDPVANLATGYAWAPDAPLGWRENTLLSPYRGSPAGGGFSTVGDLHRFALALQDGRLISETSRAWLWTDQPPHEYGGGFMITRSMAGRIVGHEGQFDGVSSQLEIYVDKGYVVVVLGNQDGAAPGLADAIRGLIAAAA
ncbi:serine hydrolase domain-containing protein [Brevundimonas sp.]|uniref:serine hydrolase domain-containing protein n=1 Tax=Brevundimonas sp. TaxID=1871086 RepID=UPI002C578983|nr:serine hydrolase domain-containing protein [Brevundimonas sp.]HWQ85319.1 serine hydrolase domain-containing protein [Brevundimonas sp.]